MTRTYRRMKQFLCIKIEQWNSSQPHGDSPFFLNFKLNLNILSLASDKVLYLVMFNGSPRNSTSTSNSPFKNFCPKDIRESLPYP